jgi:phosphoglycerate dehydrogenase-like enzyme
MPVILLTNYYDGIPKTIAQEAVPAGFQLLTLASATKECLLEMAGEAEYFLVSGRLPIGKDVLAVAKRLKMIQRTGVGTDMFDMDALKERGIPLYVNMGVSAISVAEHAMMLMLSVLRRLTVLNAEVKSGIWTKQANGVRNHELYGKTIGMVGMGNIGKAVAKMLQGFDVKIYYYDMYRLKPEQEATLGIVYKPLQEVLQAADIVSLHCPLTADTKNMMNAGMFACMKKGSILINTARGGLIDEAALVQALRTGHIKAVGLDVFSQEPPDKANALLGLDTVTATPHVGGLTYEAFRSMMVEAMQNMQLFEEGKQALLEDKRLV